MTRTASQTLFAHVVGRPDLQLDVASLLIGEWERDGLDIAHYRAMLDEWARRAGEHLEAEPDDPILAINRVLFDDLGFRGNQDDYYDPRNSFLADVLDRRTGIPITLSVVYIEVARRMGVRVRGVAFPGHFLVRHDRPGAGPVILDPFRMGMVVGGDALQEIVRNVIGPHAQLTAELLEPATRKQILMRMLTNLAVVYDRQGDILRSIEVLERIHILEPESRPVEGALERLRAQALAVN